MFILKSPLPQFTSVDGSALEDGYVYVGVVGLNPETNPISVYWDAALTVPAAQPIRTSNGRAVNGSTPANIYTSSAYSLTVRDKNGSLVYTFTNSASFDSGDANMAALAGSTGASLVGYKLGYPNATARTVENRLRERASIKDWGAVCDGVTDDTVAVQVAISDIGASAITLYIPGPTKINTATLTFGPSTELCFPQGGKIIGTSGTELVQIQHQIAAGPNQIFQNCVPRATTGQIVWPEWFGAKRDGSTNDQPAFAAAMSFLQNTGGTVQMQAGTYAVSSSVQINYNKICLQGAGNNITYIKALGATTAGVGAYGVAGTSFVSNLMLRDFSLISSVPGTSNVGLDLSYTAFAIVERMQVQDFLIGVQLLRATNSQITKVGATYTGTTNGFIGFNILGGGTTGGNASSILKDCYASGSAGYSSTGFKFSGVYMADLQFDNCETAVTDYGYYLEYSTAPNFNEDVIIRNPIVDRFKYQGILINALPANGSLSILGGWSNPNTTGAETDAIYLSSCAGLLRISNHQFCADTNYANATGIFATGSVGYKIGGCTFKDQKLGVKLVSSGYGSVIDCLFKNASGRTASYQIQGISDARTMVNGCTFDGYATQAVLFDSGSTGSGIVNCNANVSNITTRFTNSSTGGITANNSGA